MINVQTAGDISMTVKIKTSGRDLKSLNESDTVCNSSLIPGRPVTRNLAAYENHLRSIFKLESQASTAEVLNQNLQGCHKDISFS